MTGAVAGANWACVEMQNATEVHDLDDETANGGAEMLMLADGERLCARTTAGDLSRKAGRVASHRTGNSDHTLNRLRRCRCRCIREEYQLSALL